MSIDIRKKGVYMEKNNGLIGLKLIRKQQKWSQLKVSMDLNISREALSHYENGKRSPDIQMLKNMSQYFGVSIDYLINGKNYGE
jgi:transcriptional regulator with XRE-family HTH domain